MRIMSFNVLCAGRCSRKWEKRIPRVVAAIKENDPDSFGVQEAHIGWMSALRENLPEYDYVGVGRDDGKEDGEFSAVFYKKDKFTAGENGTFWLSETPDVPGKGWDAACIRICSYVMLTEKETGKKFCHLNTHLDHVGPIAMQKGVELVAKKANEICTDCPAVFTGDFNVTPESAPCKAVKDGGFMDARDVAEITDKDITFHAFLGPEEHRSVIDYVFVKGDVKVTQFRVERREFLGDVPSDHYPVIADVEF